MSEQKSDNYREYTWRKTSGYIIEEYEIKKDDKIIAIIKQEFGVGFVSRFKSVFYILNDYKLVDQKKQLVTELFEIDSTEYDFRIEDREYIYIRQSWEIVKKDRLFFPVSGTFKINYNNDVPALLTCLLYLRHKDQESI